MTETTTPAAGPVTSGERISSLDAVRGMALLGILLMNIVGFALHFAAYDNPAAAGGATGLNLWFWIVNHILFEGKMRALFSMVFGAGVILLTLRGESRGAAAADIYYRRLLWLLLFGIVHAYVFWIGDILYPYALCGLVLFPFRHMRPRPLLLIAALFVVAQSAANVGRVFRTAEKREKGEEALALESAGKKLTDEQQEAKQSWEEWKKDNQPGPDEIKKDMEEFGGGVGKVFGRRAGILYGYLHGTPYYSPWNWDIWAMMFLGMALFKLGVLSGERPVRFYAAFAAAGYAVGVTVNSFSAWNYVRTQWDPVLSGYFATTYDIGRLSVGLAHASVLILACKTGALGWLTSRLAAVGQMAFSNYIMQSIVCSTLFYGYGFGLYGKLQRYELLYVVVPIWVFQLLASPVWLRHFRFGPLEWCWRSLTYWKRQPFRQVRHFPAAEPAPSVLPG